MSNPEKIGNKVKVIEVISDSLLGGGPRHVLGLLKNIDREKFDVLLIAPRGWLTEEAKKISGVEIKIVEFKSKFDLSSLSKLKRDIAEFRAGENPFGPVIIHAHGPRAGAFCRLIVRKDEKFVYTEHLWNADYQLSPSASFFQRRGIKTICSRADLVIAVSKSVKNFLLEKIIKIPAKVAVIPNAIDISGEEPKVTRHPSRNDRELIIGTAGALVKPKGQIYLIRAFAEISKKFPEAKLEIVGTGVEKENLKKEISTLNLNAKVQLLGRQDDVKKIIKEWDIFVLPSLSESFGIVLLEAMEIGVPIVASAVGGVPEIIKSGETGVLVPAGNVEKLVKAINSLLLEKTYRARLAKNAFISLKKHYDWSKIIGEIEKIYEKLCR